MKQLFTIIAMIFVLGMNAQQPDFTEVKNVEIYNSGGEKDEFDIHQPVRNIAQEDGVISSNKCIRWLILSEYYTLKSIEFDGKAVQSISDTRFTIKAALYAKMYKNHNCSRDDYERFKILKNNWYVNSEKELFE